MTETELKYFNGMCEKLKGNLINARTCLEMSDRTLLKDIENKDDREMLKDLVDEIYDIVLEIEGEVTLCRENIEASEKVDNNLLTFNNGVTK